MKTLPRIALLLIVVTASALATATPASAGGISIQISGYSDQHGGHHYKQHHYKQHHYKQHHYKQHHYKQHHYGYRTYNHKRRHASHQQSYSTHLGYSTNQSYSKACKPIHKYISDGYGGSTKVGGTMCYDPDGNGYLVPGSRYVIDEY
jgi:hypothetical protein